jgi:hypothetical protein
VGLYRGSSADFKEGRMQPVTDALHGKTEKEKNMCNHFSFIATKNKIIAEYGVDSHEDLLQIAGIKDESRNPDFVRCELIPSEPFTLDFDKWAFNVDQDYRPDWFVAEHEKSRAVKFLKKQNHITKDVDIFTGRAWYCTANIGRMIGHASIIILSGGAISKMYGGAQIMNDYREKK